MTSVDQIQTLRRVLSDVPVRLVRGSDSVGGCARGPQRLTIASFSISKFVILISVTFEGRQKGDTDLRLPTTDSRLALLSPSVVNCLFNSRPGSPLHGTNVSLVSSHGLAVESGG
jgi:hypothetical protein